MVFYILVLYVLSHLGINPPPSLSGISKIIFIFLCPQPRVTWSFPLFALVERCQKPLFVPACDFIYSWKGLAPFSLSHLLLCHICCLHWVQFYRFKREPTGLTKLLFTHSFIKSQLLKTKRKFTTMKFPMMHTSKSKAHHKNKTQKPKSAKHLTPIFSPLCFQGLVECLTVT